MGAESQKTHFITGIDDSGGTAELFEFDGRPKGLTGPPIAGAAMVTVRGDLQQQFEASWSRLRVRIQEELGLTTPPPVHLRWMWGTNKPDKHKNPYYQAGASNDQVARWLRSACDLLLRFQARRCQFGMQSTTIPRESIQRDLGLYYQKDEWKIERRYLASKAAAKGFYRAYHSVTALPIIRILPVVAWRLDRVIRACGGRSNSILVDAFTGTDGAGAPEVLRAARSMAELESVQEIKVVESYSESSLVQAADLVAWSVNRLLTLELHNERDPPFERVFGELLQNGRSPNGTKLLAPYKIDSEVLSQITCIVYALARGAAGKIDQKFVDENLVSVEEFHERATAPGFESRTGVSVLNKVGQQRAKEHYQRMTGPQS